MVAHAQEFLAEACSGSEPMLQGRRHFAEQALARVSSLHCAERLRQMLARPGPEERLEEGALLLVRMQGLAGKVFCKIDERVNHSRTVVRTLLLCDVCAPLIFS